MLPIDPPANDRADVFLHPIIALLARAFGDAGLLSYTEPPEESPSPKRMKFFALEEYTFCSGIASADSAPHTSIDAITNGAVISKSLLLIFFTSMSFVDMDRAVVHVLLSGDGANATAQKVVEADASMDSWSFISIIIVNKIAFGSLF